ncbi:MAG: hypothetical protein R2762_05515 [Bryobacteraceae bacterium]
MSQYSYRPIDLSPLRTVSLHTRGGKVRASDFARPHDPATGVSGLIDSLPHLLAADQFRAVIDSLCHARAHGRAIVWGLGGHVVKCGLAPILLDLMRHGWVSAFAMNGAAAIHDFEIALAGHTSEDVEAVLPDGSFGSADETGREMNAALDDALDPALNIGAGEAYGAALHRLAHTSFAPHSILLQAWLARVPVTVHIAIGTDTPHTHPSADGATIGAASHRDFRLLCSILRDIDDGGVYVNLGSAVVLPEVFLKAVSTVRNLGNPLAGFTTVNFDFLQHYRPRVNVVERPHAPAGGNPLERSRNGHGYAITGHHEIMIPLLAAALREREESR